LVSSIRPADGRRRSRGHGGLRDAGHLFFGAIIAHNQNEEEEGQEEEDNLQEEPVRSQALQVQLHLFLYVHATGNQE